MADRDTCCTLNPYFKIHDGKLDEFKSVCEEFVAKTVTEPGCMFYSFSLDGNEAHCREGYDNAEAVLAHLENLGAMIPVALQLADLTRLEVHAPASEIDALREPLAQFNPQFFTLFTGFRR